MIKLGVFGGSFDPVHFGHLHIAITLFEKHQLDRVLFVPAKANPLKSSPPVSDAFRLQFLESALEGLPQFEIDTREIGRGGPSYTIDTLRELQGNGELYLLLGEDALTHFDQWKEPGEILKIAKPLVCARNSTQFPGFPHLPKEWESAFKEGWTIAPLMQISATDIRNRLKMNRFCGHLLPAKVLDLIKENRLYCSSII